MSSVRRLSFILVWTSLSLAAQTSGPPQLFQEAVAAQQRGDDALAVRKYRELLALHPEAAVVHANLGATLAHMKRYDEAIQEYRAVLASDPGNVHVRLNLALAYEAKGQQQRALEEFESLHREHPEDQQTVLLLADFYQNLKRYSDAVRVLSAIQAEHADDVDEDVEYALGSALIQAGRGAEGVAHVEKVAEKAGNADAYLLAGQTRLDLSQYDLAQRDAGAAMRINPNLAGLQTLNGMILEHTGDYAAAEAALRQALQADDRDFNAHFYLGSILYFRRETAEAKVHLQRALQLRPKSAQVRYKLALVANTEGRPEEALSELQAVVRASPDWMEPHAELSALYYRLHRAEDGARERREVERLSAAQPAAPAGTAP